MSLTLPPLHQLPDLRIDRCVFGMNGKLHLSSKLTPAELAARFAALDHVALTTPHTSKGNPNYFQATFSLRWDEDDRIVGEARLDLHFVGSGDELRLGSRTALHLNPQKLQRSILGDEACGEPGFDGSLNVLALHHRGPKVLRTLVGLVGEVVQFVIDALAAAAPDGSWEWGEMWLKAVEACRDLPSSDSIADMRLVQRTTLTGATMVQRDLYRASVTDVAGIPVVQWLETEDGPRDKAYSKRRATLRAEVVCKDRTALARLTGRQKKTLSAQAAVDLILPFVLAAAPRLDAIERHVAEVLAAGPAPMEALIELAELFVMAGGLRVGARGPTPSLESAQAARDALGSFYEIGSYDAAGAPPAVLKVLGRLIENGVLTRHSRRKLYYLHPRFSRCVLPAAAAAWAQ